LNIEGATVYYIFNSFTRIGCTVSPEWGVQFHQNGVYSLDRNMQPKVKCKA